jgi:signal transduction histidine kinase/ligand-binding sensor domain-containing protein
VSVLPGAAGERFRQYNIPPEAKGAYMSRAGLAGLVLGCMSTCGLALASTAPVQTTTYVERTWQVQDGLPEQTVQAFAQTKDRYLWIGTTGGLLRFDGAHFVLYDRDNTAAFTENNIFNLTVARDDTLWIATEGGGLIRYKDGVFRSFSAKDGLINDFVRVVFQDSKGVVWTGTDTGLLRFSGERLERVDNSNGIPALAVHAIYEDRDGCLWAGGSKLVRLGVDGPQEYRLQGEGSQTRVKSITQTRDGTVWVGTIGGLYQKTQAADSFSRVPNTSGTVRFLRETSDGTLWIGTIGHGIYKYRDQKFSQLTAPDGLPSNTALNLFEDIENNIWIGTQAGMLRLSKTPIQTVALPDAADYDAETVYQDRNGDIWVAAANLFRFHDGKVSQVHLPGISGVRVRNVFRARDGALWIGTEGRGVFRQSADGRAHYMVKDGLVNNFVRAFLEGRDGSMWIATDEGVSRWHAGKFTNYLEPNGLCYFSTRSLGEDRDGDIWIGTDHGISHFHSDHFVADEVTKGLSNEKIWAISEDSDGGLWFGTRTGGLYRWRFGKLTHYTTKQGLASNSIFELVQDKNGSFWISGPNGISVINRRELDNITEAPSQALSLTLYGISDGLETTQLYGAEKPGGIVTSRGEVWFASNEGPVRVLTDQAQRSGSVPVVIDQVLADGLEAPNRQRVSLVPDNAKIEIHYSVIQLRSQERVRFRYMLEGFDKEWTEASSERVAYYTNLPPAKYRFRVAAFEMNNPQLISETSAEITQRPHFYRTSWFLGCCVLLLTAMVWGGYRFRLRQVHMRFAAVLEERNRLAREMHDTLIQGCAGVSALLEAQSSLDDKEASTKENLLSCAREQLRTSINEAREAVWDLRHANGSATVISPILQSMTQQLSHEFAVPVEYRMAGSPFDLDQSTAHELLMVVREALHNAIRHGQPRRVEVSIRFGKNDLVVEVDDDGRGFDLAIVSRSSNGHYGVVGMKERARRMGGALTLDSQPGKGAQLTLRIPRKTSASAKEGIRA